MVAYESLKTKEKSQVKRGFKKVVVTCAGRLREWLQGELLLYVSLDLVAEQQARRNGLIIYSYQFITYLFIRLDLSCVRVFFSDIKTSCPILSKRS